MSKESYINKKFEHDRDKFEKNITISSRAFIIANEISSGMKYRQIVAKYMDQWGVSYNYMHSIITEAINIFKNDETYKHLKEINLDRLTGIYEQAIGTNNLETAIKAIDKINKTAGVYEPEKTQVNVQTDDQNITITFGGVSIEETEKNHNSEDVPFNEVDNIIKGVLDKND